jgi:hypothetical protein
MGRCVDRHRRQLQFLQGGQTTGSSSSPVTPCHAMPQIVELTRPVLRDRGLNL